MKTKAYDLNLYVIEGRLKVLAHELEISSAGDIQSVGGNFHEIVNIPVLRGNARQWENILEFFGEPEQYDELDSWYTCPVEDFSTPLEEFPAEELKKMPAEIQLGLSTLPAYEPVSYAK
jgi:hypothetical protein